MSKQGGGASGGGGAKERSSLLLEAIEVSAQCEEKVVRPWL